MQKESSLKSFQSKHILFCTKKNIFLLFFRLVDVNKNNILCYDMKSLSAIPLKRLNLSYTAKLLFKYISANQHPFTSIINDALPKKNVLKNRGSVLIFVLSFDLFNFMQPWISNFFHCRRSFWITLRLVKNVILVFWGVHTFSSVTNLQLHKRQCNLVTS